MKRNAVFIHTSPAAIGPLKTFYGAQAPELQVVNLLDDGILGMLAAGDYRKAQERLLALIATGRDAYGAEAALLTCSAVPRSTMDQLRSLAGIPVLKIDDPMADAAVRAGRRIGVIYTFAPTRTPTETLLQEAAMAAGTTCDFTFALVEGAYEALLSGRSAEHDELVLRAADGLGPVTDALVLAQVSMAHLGPGIHSRTAKPVITSLATSLSAMREALGSH